MGSDVCAVRASDGDRPATGASSAGTDQFEHVSAAFKFGLPFNSGFILMMMVVNRLVIGVGLFLLSLLRALSRPPEIPLTGVVGADCGEGHEPLEVGGLAGGTLRRVRAEHQQLESVLALTAFVFVNRHCFHLRGRVAKS